ncbi:ATP-dependent DNA helicase PIF1-like protein [Tanacetum coccineum]
MLDKYSSVVKAFRMARDWCNTHNTIDFHLRLHSDRKITRQYNALTVSEVATIIINDFGDNLPIGDIVINNKDEGPKDLKNKARIYNYERILFLHNSGTTQPGYTLLTGGQLFQQYLVDAYTAVEEKRLKWTRNNQDTLHVDLYHNLCDAVTRGDTSATGLGKRIVLPRTFTGSPRYMMHNYQDTMALYRAYGNPDLFITFTSNPKWPEIAEILAYFPWQKAHDLPEVGTRVFKLKLTELLDDLTKNTFVYVIKFQKRGLPHAHILLWIEEHSKCKTPSEIDDIISTELPSPTDDPTGYKVVTEYMLHGPCGKDVRYITCTNDGKCSKHFPKPFLAETFLDEEGYLHYRRRDNKAVCNIQRTRPLKLWETNWQALSKDILHKKWKLYKYPVLQLTDEQIRNYCLIEMQELLHRFGRYLTDFKDLPQPNPNLLTNMDNRTGKTFLYQTIISRLRSERRIVLAVSSSGIASLLLPAGRIAHSRFVIPLDLMENSTCEIKQNTQLAEIMQEVQLIIWDEAPMTQRYAFEALDITLRDILGFKNMEKRNQLFGGMTVLLEGDFRQILPVIPKAKRPEIVQACINRSELWNYCKVFTLTRNMRVNEYCANGEIDTLKQEFNCRVLAVGDGTLPAKMKEGEDEPT